MKILECIGKRVLFFDGGLGTLLQENGMQAGETPELYNITKPELLYGIHLDYLKAGADVIAANTFGANRYKLAESGISTQEAVQAAVRTAKQAVADSGKQAYVALDIGPTGKLLRPMGELPFEDAVSAYAEVAKAGEAAGADIALLETFTDTYELKAAVLAVKENTNLPVFASCSFQEDGKLLTGADAAAVVALLEGLRVDAIGVNCGGGPDAYYAVFDELMAYASTPVFVMPNAGLPRVVDGKTLYSISAQAFPREMSHFVTGGAFGIGGCCGTTPAHIQALYQAFQATVPVQISAKTRTVVSSYASTCVLGDRPVIVGERINPTGKKKMKEALLADDFAYIYQEGLNQTENGADILDVNVGMPGIDEGAAMLQAVTGLQGVTTLPLQIDTADPAVMEQALRLYNGKPMVNSVNGKTANMEQVFPLVQKYGGVVVALTLDEQGIPATAQGRLEIARRIVHKAAEYGIMPCDIVVDALTMTVSSDQSAAMVTLEALKLIKRELGLKTILGVSNVSFGLPRREVINSAFFTMALNAGLDAGIVNPGLQPMMDAYHSFLALRGWDENCAGYLARFAESASAPAAQPQDVTLYDAVRKGLAEQAEKLAKIELQKRTPTQVIDQCIIPALNEVGKGFEAKTLFLPQLMMSATAAQSAFSVIKSALAAKGSAQEKKGTIVLATVEGDIHDIGKNIAKVVLENYGYQVVDLGKNVPVQEVADYAAAHQIRLVGLSALMTTTVGNMEKTIQMLRQSAPECKIMVGGAVLTEEYAMQIGADYYVPDAMADIEIAKKIFGK